MFVSNFRRVATDAFLLAVPLTAFSGRLVLQTPGDRRVLSAKEISILPRLDVSFVRGASPGEKVTIVGAGFSKYEENNIVRVSDIVAPVISQTRTSLTFRVPLQARESRISVEVLGQEESGSFPLRVVRIRNLSGNPVEPGGQLLIWGFGFARGEKKNEVTFLGDPSTVEDDVVMENLLGLYTKAGLSINVVLGAIRLVPPTYAPTGPIQVRVGKSFDVSRGIFRFATEQVRDIVITEIRPLSVSKGGIVVLRGSGFGVLAEHNRVFFRDEFGNDVEAEVLSASPTGIRVRVPDRTSDGPVTVKVGANRGISKQAVEIVDWQPIYHTSTSSSVDQVLYPNPIRGGRLYCARVFDHVKLYDMSMREVFSVLGKDYSSAAGIDLSFLSPGVYFAKVRLGDGEELRLKLLKE